MRLIKIFNHGRVFTVLLNFKGWFMGNRTTINGKGLGLNGDKTSTGATCISSFVGFTESGKLPLHVGDKTSPCPKCGKVGEIVTGDSALVFLI